MDWRAVLGRARAVPVRDRGRRTGARPGRWRLAQSPAMSTTERPRPEPRDAYRVFRAITTRWMDNDQYGHVNNVIYYSWFDTAVNAYLIEQGALDTARSGTIGLVVETQCHYFSSLSFPQLIDAGIRVAHMGTSSVRYEVGLFAQGSAETAARGHFVHVYVDRATQRPAPLPEALRAALEPLR